MKAAFHQSDKLGREVFLGHHPGGHRNTYTMASLIRFIIASVPHGCWLITQLKTVHPASMPSPFRDLLPEMQLKISFPEERMSKQVLIYWEGA